MLGVLAAQLKSGVISTENLLTEAVKSSPPKVKHTVGPGQTTVANHARNVTQKASSFTSFKKIINSTVQSPRMEVKIDQNSLG